ncbi:hypothetical protein B8A46_03315 [Dolosigranulum pigrum]|uniref:hypothetical protein n=1 Tax=Dolosigranulum pigrum TaxID=29394 RepID=UPI000DBFEB19|nr:hypothetical protein [Dolosigranulum pigrum]RAN54306.1 hypothetical protein B8A31_00670 [Dolosigranulum pigrum]RAN57462.1 hypothetical protein B8A40_06435 [Dolosigranulum pigrum]RAN60211.1 hypothetical protein B8A46_03315 [Dolosigranulum pigrum]
MKIEKIINGYMMIALLLLFIMGRLLDYALTMDFWGAVFSSSTFYHLVALSTYIACMINMKRRGIIDSYW